MLHLCLYLYPSIIVTSALIFCVLFAVCIHRQQSFSGRQNAG